MSDQPLRLVTVPEAKSWMKVFHDADDEQIDMAIIAASIAVTDYLDLTFIIASDSGSSDELSSDAYEPVSDATFYYGETVVPLGHVEKIATLLLVRRLYEGDMGALSYGRLPDDVTALLYVRRQGLGIGLA